MKTILDEIVEKLPDEFNMAEIQAKVPVEERTPYVVVALQECERMNMLMAEIRRSLKELDLGLKVSTGTCGGMHLPRGHRLVGLVVKASASGAEDSEFDSPLRRGDIFGSSHTSDLKIGTPVVTLPGARRYRVSAGTGWPIVSIL